MKWYLWVLAVVVCGVAWEVIKPTAIERSAVRCGVNLHDLPDAEDAWNAGWGTGTEARCLKCGRSFRLGVDNLKMCWGPTAAELAAERDALQTEREREH